MNVDYRTLIKRRLAGEDLRIEKAQLCLSRTAREKASEAQKAHRAAILAAPTTDTGEPKNARIGRSPLDQAKKAAESAWAEYDAACIDILLRGLPEVEYEALRVTWNDIKEDPEKGHEANVEMIMACFVRAEKNGEVIEEIDAETLRQLLETVTNAEIGILFAAANAAQVAQPEVDDPFGDRQ